MIRPISLPAPRFCGKLDGFSDAELKAELQRRQKLPDVQAHVEKITREIGSPAGTWEVTTWNHQKLGVFKGHFADIAALLQNEAKSSLRFRPVKLTYPKNADVELCVDPLLGDALPWHVDKEIRAQAIAEWLNTIASKQYKDVQATPTNSTNIRLKVSV